MATKKVDTGIDIYFAVGEREGNQKQDMRGDLKSFVSHLPAQRYRTLQVHDEVLDGETHDSVWPRAFSNGLRRLFGSLPAEMRK